MYRCVQRSKGTDGILSDFHTFNLADMESVLDEKTKQVFGDYGYYSGLLISMYSDGRLKEWEKKELIEKLSKSHIPSDREIAKILVNT